MTLTAGVRLGLYEIAALIGHGGMGEVYRARDTKLNRDVALKILPPAFAADPDRLARFHREAQVLASLNHPHIAAIYGFEDSGDTHALVLELVEGPTLADRSAQGPIPVEEALPIAAQIAEALEAAHEQGIIHRDLKPANIKVKADGSVKVLDFGLAKLAEPGFGTRDSGFEGALSMSPTITSPAMMTGVGVILGTAAYMAPEQARGKAVDKRADIWAFGCVLYEMLTGKRPFDGHETADVIVAALSKEPDWTKFPTPTPLRIRELVQQCLTKDPRERLRDIGDARLEIDKRRREPDSVRIASDRRPARTLTWTVTLVVTALLAGFTGWQFRSPVAPSLRPVRFSFALPPVAQFSTTNLMRVAISPDGSRIAYAANGKLFVRSVDQFDGIPVSNSEGAENPFFSPDSRWLGFYAAGRLQRVSIAGGAPLTIANVGQVVGASWGPDDTIVFGGGVGAGLQRVAASGGTPSSLTTPDSVKGEVNHGLPQFLPNGRDVLFTVGTGEGSRIAVLSLTTGTWREILRPGGGARYMLPGFLVFTDTGNVRVVPFDLKTSTITGPVAPALDAIVWENMAGLESAWFAVSSRGDLVYVTGDRSEISTNPVWVDRGGRETAVNVAPALYVGPNISPDGRRVAFSRIGKNGIGQVWVLDVEHGQLVPVSSQGADYNGIWAPDHPGRLTYTSNGGLFETFIDRQDPPVRLMTRENYQAPTSWSPDGRVLAFMDITSTRTEIWTMERGHAPERLLQSASNAGNARFSPRAGWLAYVSDETGQYEVYVRQYPGSGRGTQVSKGGGRQAVWSPDGRELFYRSADRMMAVKIATQPTFRAEPPVELWQRRYFSQEFLAPNYDVAPDGRFLMLQVADEAANAARSVNVVMNWFDEVKQRLTAAK